MSDENVSNDTDNEDDDIMNRMPSLVRYDIIEELAAMYVNVEGYVPTMNSGDDASSMSIVTSNSNEGQSTPPRNTGDDVGTVRMPSLVRFDIMDEVAAMYVNVEGNLPTMNSGDDASLMSIVTSNSNEGQSTPPRNTGDAEGTVRVATPRLPPSTMWPLRVLESIAEASMNSSIESEEWEPSTTTRSQIVTPQTTPTRSRGIQIASSSTPESPGEVSDSPRRISSIRNATRAISPPSGADLNNLPLPPPDWIRLNWEGTLGAENEETTEPNNALDNRASPTPITQPNSSASDSDGNDVENSSKNED